MKIWTEKNLLKSEADYFILQNKLMHNMWYLENKVCHNLKYNYDLIICKYSVKLGTDLTKLFSEICTTDYYIVICK